MLPPNAAGSYIPFSDKMIPNLQNIGSLKYTFREPYNSQHDIFKARGWVVIEGKEIVGLC
jgi:hypothetical protein